MIQSVVSIAKAPPFIGVPTKCAACGQEFAAADGYQRRCPACKKPGPKRIAGFPGPKPKATRTLLHGMLLSRQEWVIAQHVAGCKPLKQIAADTHLTDGTVKVYLSRIYLKMRAVQPDCWDKNMFAVLGQWTRCHLCTAFRDDGGGI